MPKVFADISVSLDGFVTGPNPGPEQSLGEGGERLHEWLFGLASWREPHGLEGGEANADADVLEEAMGRVGAGIMGRRMFDDGEGPWGDEPSIGRWGAEPPFHGPVFVLTHHAREPVELAGGTTFHFVTDGIESAIAPARETAGDRTSRSPAARASSSRRSPPVSSTRSRSTSSPRCWATEFGCSTRSVRHRSTWSSIASSTRPPSRTFGTESRSSHRA